jgi:hypothetical protein
MSSTQWVCWDCRRIARRKRTTARPPRCSQCGGATEDVGMRLRLTVREDARGWREVRAQRRAARHAREAAQREALVRRRHTLEQRILALEAKPVTPARARTLRVLRRQLKNT